MKHEERKNVKKLIYKYYFEEQMHASKVSEIVGISFSMVKFYAYQFKLTQNQYLDQTYTKEFVEKFLEAHTYEELAAHIKVTPGRIKRFVYKKGIKRNTQEHYKVNKVNSEFYNSVLFEKEFYYFVGLFASDGCYRKNRAVIVIKNKGALELLTKLANIAGHNNIRQLKNGFISLTFTDKNLIDKLISIGIPYNQKTYSLKNIFVPNKECFLSMLTGLLDGDGYVGKTQSKVFNHYTSLHYGLCNYNLEFLKNIQKQIKELLGYDSSISVPNNSKVTTSYGKTVPTLSVGVRQGSHKFFEELYTTSPLFLKCKYNIYKCVIDKVMI